MAEHESGYTGEIEREESEIARELQDLPREEKERLCSLDDGLKKNLREILCASETVSDKQTEMQRETSERREWHNDTEHLDDIVERFSKGEELTKEDVEFALEINQLMYLEDEESYNGALKAIREKYDHVETLLDMGIAQSKIFKNYQRSTPYNWEIAINKGVKPERLYRTVARNDGLYDDVVNHLEFFAQKGVSVETILKEVLPETLKYNSEWWLFLLKEGIGINKLLDKLEKDEDGVNDWVMRDVIESAREANISYLEIAKTLDDKYWRLLGPEVYEEMLAAGVSVNSLTERSNKVKNIKDSKVTKVLLDNGASAEAIAARMNGYNFRKLQLLLENDKSGKVRDILASRIAILKNQHAAELVNLLLENSANPNTILRTSAPEELTPQNWHLLEPVIKMGGDANILAENAKTIDGNLLSRLLEAKVNPTTIAKKLEHIYEADIARLLAAEMPVSEFLTEEIWEKCKPMSNTMLANLLERGVAAEDILAKLPERFSGDLAGILIKKGLPENVVLARVENIMSWQAVDGLFAAQVPWVKFADQIVYDQAIVDRLIYKHNLDASELLNHGASLYLLVKTAEASNDPTIYRSLIENGVDVADILKKGAKADLILEELDVFRPYIVRHLLRSGVNRDKLLEKIRQTDRKDAARGYKPNYWMEKNKEIWDEMGIETEERTINIEDKRQTSENIAATEDSLPSATDNPEVAAVMERSEEITDLTESILWRIESLMDIVEQKKAQFLAENPVAQTWDEITQETEAMKYFGMQDLRNIVQSLMAQLEGSAQAKMAIDEIFRASDVLVPEEGGGQKFESIKKMTKEAREKKEAQNRLETVWFILHDLYGLTQGEDFTITEGKYEGAKMTRIRDYFLFDVKNIGAKLAESEIHGSRFVLVPRYEGNMTYVFDGKLVEAVGSTDALEIAMMDTNDLKTFITDSEGTLGKMVMYGSNYRSRLIDALTSPTTPRELWPITGNRENYAPVMKDEDLWSRTEMAKEWGTSLAKINKVIFEHYDTDFLESTKRLFGNNRVTYAFDAEQRREIKQWLEEEEVA